MEVLTPLYRKRLILEEIRFLYSLLIDYLPQFNELKCLIGFCYPTDKEENNS